jgi:cellulose synthase/poly-beta-1,6-N-acetylglucosamine synthase-like glycosyltransferase
MINNSAPPFVSHTSLPLLYSTPGLIEGGKRELISVSIGIPAYNEASNIGHLLRNLSDQKLKDDFILKEIIVVASGCTDETEDIVKTQRAIDHRIMLLVEKERRGKASAVNLLLKENHSTILVMEAADTLPKELSLHHLVAPFRNISVGATGGRPLPVNPENTVIGWIPHVIWDLHHEMATLEQKQGSYFHISGEFCAIRAGIIRRIPETIVNDDAYIGLQIKRAGYSVGYVPEATVSMRGPATIFDILSQRRRVVYGHRQLEINYGADIASTKPTQVARIFFKVLKLRPNKFIGTFAAMTLEALSHTLARSDFKKGKLHQKWRMVPSTKSLA